MYILRYFLWNLGIQTPRAASNGSALPSARLVSTVVFGGADRALNTTTLALMQFGQLINHDFQSTTQFTFSNKGRKNLDTVQIGIFINFSILFTLQQQMDRTSAAVLVLEVRWMLPNFIQPVCPFPYQQTIDSGTSTQQQLQPAWTISVPWLAHDWTAASDMSIR